MGATFGYASFTTDDYLVSVLNVGITFAHVIPVGFTLETPDLKSGLL